MTELDDLYRLQCLDSERDEKQRRLMEVEAALKDNSALQQARRELSRAEKHAQERKIQERDLELEVDGLSARIERSEKRLYGGKVKNPKELADLQAELAALKRRRRRLEDDLLEAMIEREEAEGAHEQALARLDEVEFHWSARQADLKAEREELQTRLAEIQQERERLLPGIDASDLTDYKALRERRQGQAVAEVRGGACGACGVMISPRLEWQLRQGEVVHCGNCGRIVVAV